jgi:hypothetical protein
MTESGHGAGRDSDTRTSVNGTDAARKLWLHLEGWLSLATASQDTVSRWTPPALLASPRASSSGEW